MASIITIKRKGKKGIKTYYYLQYKDDNDNWTRMYLKDANSKIDANKALSIYKAGQFNDRFGIIIKVIDISIEKAIDEYIRDVLNKTNIKGRSRRKGTIDRNIATMTVIKRWFDYRAVYKYKKISESLINDFRPDLEKEPFNYMLGGIREYQKLFIRFLKWSSEKKYFEHLDYIKDYQLVKQIEIYNQKIKLYNKEGTINLDDMLFYSQQEQDFLFKNILPQYHDILLFISKTGRRANEAITLKWNEYDSNKKIIRLSVIEGRKNKTEEIFPLSEDAIKIINKQPKINTNIFNNSRSKGPIIYANLRKAIDKVFENTDIKGKKIHTLRHTFASELLNKGVNVKVIQKLLGHKSSIMTDIYTHSTEQALFDAVNCINDDK